LKRTPAFRVYSFWSVTKLVGRCSLGKGKVDVERPVISYITTGRLYIGIYRAEILTTQLVEGNVSQQLQKVGLGEF